MSAFYDQMASLYHLIFQNWDESIERQAGQLTSIEEISRNGGKAVFLALDVTEEAAWQDVTNRILHDFAKLDIVVNNAGLEFRLFFLEGQPIFWTPYRGRAVRIGHGDGGPTPTSFASSRSIARVFPCLCAFQIFRGHGLDDGRFHTGIMKRAMRS